MSFLLDTNVVSELRKAPARIDPHVAAWANRAVATEQFLSVITLFEIELGVLQMERRDPRQGSALRQWLEVSVRRAFADRTLSVDGEVARRAAELHVPDPRPERDGFIAATALVHGLTVVTRNVGDFESAGVKILNPWEVES